MKTKSGNAPSPLPEELRPLVREKREDLSYDSLSHPLSHILRNSELKFIQKLSGNFPVNLIKSKTKIRPRFNDELWDHQWYMVIMIRPIFHRGDGV